MDIWAYGALVFVLAVSSAGPPLPATLSLTVAAVAARHGHDNLILLCAVATLATVVGDVAGYALGRLLGTAVDRSTGTEWWRTHRLTRRLSQTVLWLDRRTQASGPLVFVSRWGLTPIAPAINLLIGARRFPFRRFVLWDTAGELLGVLRVALPSYALGQSAGIASLPLAIGATLVLGAMVTAAAGRFWTGASNARTELAAPKE